jgi:SAM-dependent methyltransferase
MPSDTFHHLFGRQAQSYAKFRPGYPQELFDFLVSKVSSRHQAWDCGTGSGQAATALSAYFDSVIATDVNSSQIEMAERKPNIDYRVLPAEATDIPDASIDLVTSANAVHWFDVSAFFKEVQRVLKPGGVVAVWCYNSVRVDGPAQAVLSEFTAGLKQYWPSPIELVTNNYKTLTFPFEEIAAPDLCMKVEWTAQQLVGYVSTWSAVQRCIDNTGIDPTVKFRGDLEPHFPQHDQLCTVRFPLPMRVGRLLKGKD